MKYYFKYILLLLILFILPIPLYILNRIDYLEEESIYGIILFWGQSNMVGNAWQYLSDYNNNLSGEDEIDSRLEKLGVYEFSTNSDIDIDIVSKYTSIMHYLQCVYLMWQNNWFILMRWLYHK